MEQLFFSSFGNAIIICVHTVQYCDFLLFLTLSLSPLACCGWTGFSTGARRFPPSLAAHIALTAVQLALNNPNCTLNRIIFVSFPDSNPIGMHVQQAKSEIFNQYLLVSPEIIPEE
jgi:hypothetical protein